MEPNHSTDYLGAIPCAPIVGSVEPDKKPRTIRRFGNAAVADLALAALVIIAAVMVALVIINWSR
jgi:hypothetical protein